MNPGSIGEMPPNTRFSFGLTSRIQSDATFTIFENTCHPGSISKSQCDLLLGSFQIITASTNRSLLRAARAPLADVYLFFGMIGDIEAGTPQHRLHTGAIRDPPVRAVTRIMMLNEVHFREVIVVEDVSLPERVIVFDLENGLAAALH